MYYDDFTNWTRQAPFSFKDDIYVRPYTGAPESKILRRIRKQIPSDSTDTRPGYCTVDALYISGKLEGVLVETYYPTNHFAWETGFLQIERGPQGQILPTFLCNDNNDISFNLKAIIKPTRHPFESELTYKHSPEQAMTPVSQEVAETYSNAEVSIDLHGEHIDGIPSEIDESKIVVE